MDYKFPENKKVGVLLNPDDIKLQRIYFEEMVDLLGIQVLYRSLVPGVSRKNRYAEIDTCYNPPKLVGCVFNEHIDQKTCKKLGWNTEQITETTAISVPYGLEGLQEDCIFIVPTGIDGAEGRMFKVVEMSNIQLYPASITCRIAPLYESEISKNEVEDFSSSNNNLLNDGDLFDEK